MRIPKRSVEAASVSIPRSWTSVLLAGTLALSACISGGSAAARPPQGDDRLRAELARQETWAAETTAGRASAQELKQAQGGDAAAQADLRKRFRQLVRAAARATWIRQATPAALDQAAPADQAKLIASFDRAAQLRRDAWNAAEAIAEALAQAPGRPALSLADLRRGLVTVRSAAAAEARLAQAQAAAAKKAPAAPGAPAPSGDAAQAKAPPAPADAKAAAAATTRPRLAPAPAPVPTPFVEAAALLIDAHPRQEDGLRAFRPELTEEAAQIQAALDDLRARKPPPGAEAAEAQAGGAGPAAGAAPAPAAEAASGEPTLTVGGDALAALRKRGPPKTIRLLPDGNFVFHYDAPGRCARPPCEGEDLAFGADGSRLAPAARKPAAAGPDEAPAPRDDVGDEGADEPGPPPAENAPPAR